VRTTEQIMAARKPKKPIKKRSTPKDTRMPREQFASAATYRRE